MNKSGDIVTIYEDPVTETKPEGKAKLVALISANFTDETEYWEVEFLDDGYSTARMVKK